MLRVDVAIHSVGGSFVESLSSEDFSALRKSASVLRQRHDRHSPRAQRSRSRLVPRADAPPLATTQIGPPTIHH
jgi:hypothetical protein